VHSSVVVDASVWASLLMPPDPNHVASVAWSSTYITAGALIVVPELMLVELAAALVRQTQQPTTVKQTVRGLYHSVLKIAAADTNLLQLAMELAVDLRLKGAEAMYVALAHQLGVPLISWDKEQLQRSSSAIETFAPDSYPF
jgi:predicted nucleic acid-binding protein